MAVNTPPAITQPNAPPLKRGIKIIFRTPMVTTPTRAENLKQLSVEQLNQIEGIITGGRG
jgi:hypothetical protein